MSSAARHRSAALVVVSLLSVLTAIARPVEASTLATLELSTDRASPGQEITFRGWYYNDVHPVTIHWGGLDGPVLATVTPDTFRVVHNHFRSIEGSLRVPPDARPGTHLLIATQDFAPPGKITWGVPARAVIQVGDGAGQPDEEGGSAAPRRRESVLLRGSPGTAQLLVAGAVGAALAGLLVGLAVLVRNRRVAS
jgi:hypothetical protein